ncbi:EAL domain-containing protein [Neiella marina]|uniref:EAL domain-containing protein n=1 Tax=Neiella holothuriorum TaxID=2870530 RepID=A0ABS7EJM2_9GAMM|nr:EAL domain-containing protein [Neiella holothuriorum]MBW8192068.1 EAL domain-containing protein [Neiella holothuriorum]
MTLYRQVLLLLVVMTIVSLSAVMMLNIKSSSDSLRVQQQVSIESALTALGMRLAPVLQPYDRALAESTMLAAFDGAFFRSIDVEIYENGEHLRKVNQAQPAGVPSWFTQLFEIIPMVAEAPITTGWNEVATIRIEGHPGFVQAQLWQLSVHLMMFYGSLFVIMSLLTVVVLRVVIKRPLTQIEQQVSAIEQREFGFRIPLPRTRELRQVVKALNHLTGILSEQFKANTAQLATLKTRVQQDPETKVANRRHLINELQSRLSEQQPQAVVMLSLHDRDRIRKHYGYKQWLDLMQQSVDSLRQEFDDQQVMIGRLSETDFAVLIPVLPKQDLSEPLAKVAQHMDSLHAKGTAPFESTCAIAGVPVAIDDNVTDVFTRLDHALRDAEQQGQNPWLWRSEDAAADKLRSGQQWVNLLRRRLRKGELQLRVQSLVAELGGASLHDEVYAGIEDEDGKPLNAAIFVPVIEQFDLGSELDQAVLQQVRQQAEFSSGAAVAINVSLSSIRDTRFLQALAEVPADERQRVYVELAEVYVGRDRAAVASFVAVLRSLGYRVGIDNVGVATEQAAADLGYLKSLRPDYLKLSAALCRQLDEQNLSVVAAVATTARNLDIPVYATAVEQEAQLKSLQECGVQGFQGFINN